MVVTALLGNVFQQWIFLCSWAYALAGWRPSHTNLFRLCHLRTPRLTGLSRWSLWRTDLIENTFSCSCYVTVWRGSCDRPTENAASWSCLIVVWCHCCRGHAFIVPLHRNMSWLSANMSQYFLTWCRFISGLYGCHSSSFLKLLKGSYFCLYVICSECDRHFL
jgi:hypothetical protein